MEASRSEYREIQRKIFALSDKFLELACKIYDEKQVQEIEKTEASKRDALNKNVFTVVVIGEMKHGKSTFLNAMLQKPAFPKNVMEATATVTYLKHNDTIKDEHPDWMNKAVVRFTDPSKPIAVVDHLELEKYTTCLNRGELNVAEDVKEVVIYSDSPFVRDGVTVVDTPGTNSTIARHEQITYTQIDKSNAAIFLFKAAEPGKASDYRFLSDTAKKINKFFFVVNRIDEIGGLGPEADKVIANIRKKPDDPDLVELLKKANFFPTSGLLALLARYDKYIPNEKFKDSEWEQLYQNNPERRQDLLKESGMVEFEDALLKFLFRGQRNIIYLQGYHKSYLTAVAQIEQIITERKNVLNNNTTLDELNSKKQNLEVEYERQKEKVAAASGDLTDKLSKALTNFIQIVEVEAENVMEKFAQNLDGVHSYYALKTQWEELCAQLNHICARFSSHNKVELKDQIQYVFRAADTRLRGELNKNLNETDIFVLPETSEISIVLTDVTTVDNSELADTDKEISEYDRQLQGMAEAAGDLELQQQELEDLKQAKQDHALNIERGFQHLGDRPGVEQVMVQVEHLEERKHGGLIGKCLDILFGPKEVICPAEYRMDDSARRAYDEGIARLQRQEAEGMDKLEEKIQEVKEKLGEAKARMVKLQQTERLKAEVMARKNQLKHQLEEKTQHAEEEALQIGKNKLQEALRTNVENFVDELRAIVGKCRAWADSYIVNIQLELSGVMDANKTELAELMELLKTEEQNKEAELGKLDAAWKLCREMREALENLNDAIKTFINGND